MRKINYILFLGFSLAAMGTQAQNYTDALRYSTEELTGTARFKAMSGAFGALGGDPSAININRQGVLFSTQAKFHLALITTAKREILTS